MNAVRNNWERYVRCRLWQCSHFLVPCKYCITEIPAVSCRLGIPHNPEMSTLTENLSQDRIVTRVWTSFQWTETVFFGRFQIQMFVLVFLLEKTELNEWDFLWWFLFLFFFPSLLTSIRSRGKGCQRPRCMWCWCEAQQTEDPKGVLTRANNLPQQL